MEAAQSGPGTGADGLPKRDKDAGWHVKADSRGNMKSTYGYSIHTGVPSHGLQANHCQTMDEDGFIHRQTVTPGNAHDSTERDTLLLGDEAALYADAAYSSRATRKKLERFGIEDQVQRKGYRGHPLSDADAARNDEIAVTRSGGERPFATYKSRYGLAVSEADGVGQKPDFLRHRPQHPERCEIPVALRPAGTCAHWISVPKVRNYRLKPDEITASER